MAQITLVGVAVPRRGCRDVRRVVRLRAGEEARGVGDDVRLVVFAHEAVDLLARDAGAAGAGL